MKRWLYVLIAGATLGGGCAATGDHSRESLTPAKALIGRWRMGDGAGLVSFSADGTYRFVDERGNTGTAAYEVLAEEPAERTITTRIRLIEYNGNPVEEIMEQTVIGRFSENCRTHSGTIVGPAGEESFFSMEYIGDAPEAVGEAGKEN
jgi:hypothetical protein